MLSRTEAGVVVAKEGGCVTILLKPGNRIKAHVKNTTLKLGDKCHVAFNNASGKITKVLDHDEHSIDITMTPTEVGAFPTAEECELLAKDEERECSRSQKFEDWESAELELWSKEGSRSPED